MSTVFITGANRGIGLGLVRALLAAGHDVVAACRTPERCPQLAELAKDASPPRLEILKLDVTDDSSVADTAARVAARFPAIDILINNAGIYPEGGDEAFADVPLELFQRAMEVNYLGAIRVTKAFLPLVRKSNRGRIVNVSSGAATITTKADARRYCYGPSKTALNMFTRTLAHELKPPGIVTAAISPGWVRTEMGGPDADLSVEEAADAMVKTLEKLSGEHSGLFLDRFGNPDAYAW